MRIRRMVEEDNPMLQLYDQDAWAIERNYAGEDLKRVLISLRVNWNGLAYMLEGFSGEDWSRPGRHPEAGASSVQPWAAGEVTHIGEHLDQTLLIAIDERQICIHLRAKLMLFFVRERLDHRNRALDDRPNVQRFLLELNLARFDL